ncbi:hypothetical protein C2E23DRAFT_423431 [Lenzites betulinus]|nr:hypothetical protein C2E23DRAFT_423431 [Lenzites betulinus]
MCAQTRPRPALCSSSLPIDWHMHSRVCGAYACRVPARSVQISFPPLLRELTAAPTEFAHRGTPGVPPLVTTLGASTRVKVPREPTTPRRDTSCLRPCPVRAVSCARVPSGAHHRPEARALIAPLGVHGCLHARALSAGMRPVHMPMHRQGTQRSESGTRRNSRPGNAYRAVRSAPRARRNP